VEVVAMTNTDSAEPFSLRCLLGFHSWTVRYNDAGERYDECRRCHKADAYMPLALPHM
jgi:hypothetical protein